jgi:hypothetical protein
MKSTASFLDVICLPAYRVFAFGFAELPRRLSAMKQALNN